MTTATEIAKMTEAEYPAEVRALPTDKLRLFTLHYLNHRNGARASREAGYLPETATAEDHAQNAYKILHRSDVVDAIIALTRRQLRSLAPTALNTLKYAMESPFHKDSVKASLAILERTDSVTQKIDVRHTHVVDHENEAINQLRSLKALGVAREKLVEVFGQFGLERLEAKLEPEAIDAEYTEVEDPDFNPDGSLKV